MTDSMDMNCTAIYWNRRDKSTMADKWVVRIAALFPLTTLLQGFGAFDAINKFLIIPLLLLAAFSLAKNRMHARSYVLLCLFLVPELFALSLTTWTSQAISEAPRSLFVVVFFLYCINRYNAVVALCLKDISFLKGVMIVWTIAVAASIPLSSSWDIQWGGSSYFVSYTDSAFQLMPAAMMILAINLMCLRCGQSNLETMLFSVIPLFAGLQGGSRTYFILAIGFFFLIFLNMRLTKLEKSLLSFFIILLFLYFIAGSGIASKFENVTSAQQQMYANTDALGALTSGRSDFWKYDIAAFFDLPFFQYLIGNGFDFSFSVNKAAVGISIYAHNDFINCLMETGIIGLMVYLFVVFDLFKKAKLSGVSNAALGIIVFCWFFNAFVNGFYSYTCAVLALSFFIFAMSDAFKTCELNRIQKKDKK